MPDYSKTYFYKIVCNDLTIKDLYVNVKDYNYNVYKFIREHGDWQNWSMILIEQRACGSKLEAAAIEREHYGKLRATLNKCVPNQTKQECVKKYDEQNKEAIRAYKNEKHTCECGGCYTNASKARHFRSIKHQQYNPQEI